ncbi:PAS domain-containing protein [Nocardioides sp. J2M5]|uniref:PAS domain-containing protein n=1 Tax=Nocardioides palaemonis TaxID=2829810 RepID=UPI001BA90168|nr:PAS domain-containing protein [Nocardioides palaemonis]MBS2936212.1 PAS domain-containing protein [Nocardioides palaemonis]
MSDFDSLAAATQAARTVRPTGVERSFGQDEVIVTKTDLKGRITYANDVFCRVSAIEEADLLGRPHSIIRHPEMPKAVFQLLWDTLKDRRELFAYVVNLAGDGAHYWVLAHVTPSIGPNGEVVGYHSNRRLPDPRAIREIEPIYRTLAAEERRHGRAADAARVGADLLHQMLAERNTDYDRFVWSLTNGAAA